MNWKCILINIEWLYPMTKNQYHQNDLIIKPNEAIPLLIKVQSYSINLSNLNKTVWVYRKNGKRLWFLNITIVKVFPIIDYIFRYYLPESRYSTVKVPNPSNNIGIKHKEYWIVIIHQTLV